MKKFKKLISILLFIISCFVLCFNSFAMQNSTLSGKVTETSLKSASGAICYVLVNKGDSANIVRKVGKDDSIRVYYENRSKKTSKIQLIQVDTEKNNKETVLKTQPIGKGKNGYFDKDAYDILVDNKNVDHTANTNNPHKVTLAQVLGGGGSGVLMEI